MNDRITCAHVVEIADALARHDFIGLPNLAELNDDIAASYLALAERCVDLDGGSADFGPCAEPSASENVTEGGRR